ncbi:MAG: DUF397 domain-containing protein [Mycobacterium sp.]|nr:DUF397 domain-containing protein [Mycobacterium sp.]
MSTDLITAGWRKSSRSNGSGGACVEVCAGYRAILNRHTERPDGATPATRHAAPAGIPARKAARRYNR